MVDTLVVLNRVWMTAKTCAPLLSALTCFFCGVLQQAALGGKKCGQTNFALIFQQHLILTMSPSSHCSFIPAAKSTAVCLSSQCTNNHAIVLFCDVLFHYGILSCFAICVESCIFTIHLTCSLCERRDVVYVTNAYSCYLWHENKSLSRSC